MSFSQELGDYTDVDVLVAGTGAGGLSAAFTAASHGLKTVVVEKAAKFGGTTAVSGGWVWIPNSRHAREEGIQDSIKDARSYLQAETGNFFDGEKIDTFLKHGPEMLDYFEENSAVRFSLGAYFSDYHPEQPGGKTGGRSLNAEPFDLRELGQDKDRLAPALREIMFLGMMIGSNRELKHFFEAARSVKSFGVVAGLLARHAIEVLRNGRAMRLTNGNALAARLARSVLDKQVPIFTSTPLQELVIEGGRVVGAIVKSEGRTTEIRARRGVVLATGGFPHNTELRKALYPHAQTGTEHYSPAATGNTGDGLRAAEKAGAIFEDRYPQAAAWVPVSLVPKKTGPPGYFPHLVDRAKPGVIAVRRDGKRFVNEANSYHDVIAELIRATPVGEVCEAFLVVDHRTIRRYGLGFVKPFPIPLQPSLASGYLKRGRTIRDLANATGIDPIGFENTIRNFNGYAKRDGSDPEFGRGTTGYNRYLGDPEHKPNPCVAPIESGPFYAIRIVPGDLGSFVGLTTDSHGHALDSDRRAIPGLYAVGNDAASIMGGNYPGGGITLGPAMTFGYLAGLDLASGGAES
ncbi:FAD-dependent oxidoreductase [Rhizobium sp. Root1204]|uniref:FAD-dependent oxidoreductase n=1 Tax=Rhizobium sp. Root1204 TaxID=1736428 RepID=UPI00071402BE|nr:FAD-dependent oxidoreductase [Rhizobium sp. Root1204]KQV41380.1 3-oxosteroid 1-dehydrogenase [Rhizobium sp. Root1204]